MGLIYAEMIARNNNSVGRVRRWELRDECERKVFDPIDNLEHPMANVQLNEILQTITDIASNGGASDDVGS